MKIDIKAAKPSAFCGLNAHVKASGDAELLIPMLERALEIAQNFKWDTKISELYTAGGGRGSNTGRQINP